MSGIFVFIVSVLTLCTIYGILSLILNLEAGWAGLWDLGTAGLLAAGAYTFVIFTIHAEQLDAGHEILFSPE